MDRPSTLDQLQRPVRDLRISVTDRCNFRCRYCMPAEVFGPEYRFLPREEILRFEEIERLARVAVSLGVRKVRLTGGEPLLRRGVDDLVGMLATIEGLEDLAITTNGVLLAHHAEALRLAGLDRVTVSLDALDASVFARMNGVGAKVERVLAGIETAQVFGLGVKVNTVVQRGVNEGEILPLVRWARERLVPVRFIEYMDVGETNGWRMEHVVPSREIREAIAAEFPLEDLAPVHHGEVARRYGFRDGRGEVGIISSVTQPFCRGCTRLRLSAEGKLFTCLFAGEGFDVRALLRSGAGDGDVRAAVEGLWQARTDRYSEERGQGAPHKVEMSYIGG
jgi:cyclic pyranopterin phosphate synthase